MAFVRFSIFFDRQYNQSDNRTFRFLHDLIELAKIPNTDYKDYPVKVNGTWYIRRRVGKVVYDGSEANWYYYVLGASGFTQYYRDLSGVAHSTSSIRAMSDYFTSGALDDRYRTANLVYTTNAGIAFNPYTSDFADITAFKQWLSTHPTTVYYALANPTVTEITNQTLIDQLEALASATLNQGTNNIFTEIATGNAMPTLELNWVEWEKYNRHNVYIWNDDIDDWQVIVGAGA